MHCPPLAMLLILLLPLTTFNPEIWGPQLFFFLQLWGCEDSSMYFLSICHLSDESAYGGVLEGDEIILQSYKLRLS